MTVRPLFLHIGASKTGTSALQRGLFDSADALAAQGIGLPLPSRDAHVRRVLRPLGWRPTLGFSADPRPGRLSKLGSRVASTAGDRLLMTCEDLCEADEARIRMLVDVLESAGTQVQVVLSLRGLAAVVPSEWQQLIKRKLDLDYPSFLERLRDREGPWAAQFWQRQDVVAMVDRWAAVVGHDRIDVVVTPSRSTDPEGLYRLFGGVVGFDPATMSWPERDINASWGFNEAEVYRRVNAALGSRLPQHQRGYLGSVRTPMVKAALPRRASDRITFPPEHLAWLQDVARSHVEALGDRGVRVHGDAASLVPDESATRPLPPVDEAAIARAAVEALANVAVFHDKQARRGRDGGRG